MFSAKIQPDREVEADAPKMLLRLQPNGLLFFVSGAFDGCRTYVRGCGVKGKRR
jgi:hypothetical protein